jgi:hypothetical protein
MLAEVVCTADPDIERAAEHYHVPARQRQCKSACGLAVELCSGRRLRRCFRACFYLYIGVRAQFVDVRIQSLAS